MDYIVFLLSSAREHWEETGDVKQAMVGAMAHSGRVILGVAVLLDAFLVRLLLLPVFLRLAGSAAWYLPA